jgi:hypothetical protein
MLGIGLGVVKNLIRRFLTKAQEVAALNPVFWGDSLEAYAKSKFAVALDGSNDYLDNGSVADFDYTDTFSISATFQSAAITGGSTYPLCGTYNNVTKKGWYAYWTSGKIRFYIGDSISSRIFVESNNTFSNNTFYNVTWTFNGNSSPAASDIKIYVNGVDQPLTALTDTFSDNSINGNTFNVGRSSDGSLFGQAHIDQLIPFSKVLTQAEITALYNSGNGVHHKDLVGTESYYSSIVAWYDFNTIPNFGRDYHGESHAVSLNGSKKLTLPYQSGGAFDRAFNEPWSIVTWAKPSAVAGGYDIWFFKYEVSGKYIELINTSGTSFRFIIRETSTTDQLAKVFTTTFDVTNQFVHIAFTYDGSTNASGLKMFLNGVEQTNITVNTDTLTATTRLAVDTDFGSASEHTFDELSIYHDELTSTEVATLYNGGIVAPARTLHTDNLVSDYSFNEQNLELIGRDSHGSNDLTPVSIVESDLVGGKGSLDLTEVSIDSSNAVLGHIEGAAAGSDEVTKWTDRSASGFDVVQTTIADAATYVGNGFGSKGSFRDGELDINPEPFNFTGDFAIGCWFKQDELTQFRFPIGVWGSTGNRSFGIRNGSGGAGIQFAVSINGSSQVNTSISDKPIAINQWYFGFGWHENGVQIGFRMWDIGGNEIGVEQLEPHTTGAFNSTAPFRVGGHTNTWNGEVGDVYVFDRILTSEEQQKLIDYSIESAGL